MLLSIIGIMVVEDVQAQKSKTIGVRFPLSLPAVIKNITKDNRLEYNVPEDIAAIAKNASAEMGGANATFSLGSYVFGKTARPEKGEKPSFIFEIVSTGIADVAIGDPYQGKYKIINPDGTSIEKSGYMADITFRFPFSVLIKDSLGTLLKTIIISYPEDEHHMVFHASFLKVITLSEKPEVLPIGFDSPTQLTANYTSNLEKVKSRTAKNVLHDYYKTAAFAINLCFSETNKKTNGTPLETLVSDETNDFEELNTAIDSLKSIMEAGYNSSSTAFSEKLININEVFIRFYTQKGIEDRSIRKICLYNLILSSAIAVDLENLMEYYLYFYEEFYPLHDLFSNCSLDKIISYNRLNQSNEVYISDASFAIQMEKEIEYNKKTALIDAQIREKARSEAEAKQNQADEEAIAQRKQEARMKRLKELHKEGPGTIYDIDGKEHYGYLIMDLGQDETSGLLNLDAGKLVMLMDIQTKKFIANYRCNNISRVVFDNTEYFPVTYVTGFVNKTHIMPKLYFNQDITLYYDVENQEYIIKRKSQDKAYYVRQILKDGKISEVFFAECPDSHTLAQSLNTDIYNLDDVKKLVDAICSQCH